MVGHTFRKFILFITCLSMAAPVLPVHSANARPHSARITKKDVKLAFRNSLNRIKSFITFDYLLHCDCPNHKKNQTLKNQIRRHPERFAAYATAGIGIAFGIYKLFTFGSDNPGEGVNPTPESPRSPAPNPNRNIPQEESEESSDTEEISGVSDNEDAPPAAEDNQGPNDMSEIHSFTYEQLLRQKQERQRLEQELQNQHKPRIEAILYQEEHVHAQEHTFETIQIKQAENPGPTQTPTPPSTDLDSKGKEEDDDSDLVEHEQNSQNNSFILVSSVHGKLKPQLSINLQNLNRLASLTIPHLEGNPFDSEDMILLGATLNHALIAGDQQTVTLLSQEHPKAVRALIWYYYALACGKQQFFEEGTFIIAHPQAPLILNFINKDTIKSALPALYRVDNAYERISSHFDKYMKWAGIKEQHYGIDISHLPTGKQTLLFGHVNRDKNIIFIKPENHGTNTVTDLAHHAKGYAESVQTKTMASLNGGPSGDDAPEFRKERVPTEILNRFKILNDNVLMLELIIPADHEQRYREAQARGISYMYQVVEQYVRGLDKEPELQVQAQKLLEMMREYDHLDLRFGREVILTQAELNYLSLDDYQILIDYYTLHNQ